MAVDRHAIVIGGSSGIGAAIARAFRAEGEVVTVLDLVEPDEEFRYLRCDASSAQHVEQSLAPLLEQAPVATVICSTRYRPEIAVDDLRDRDAWEQGLKSSLIPYYNVASAVCRSANARRPLSIVNVSSILSELVTVSQPMFYHAAKAAIESITRYVAVRYGEHGVRANAILPGLISKGGAEHASHAAEASVYARIANVVPLRRSGTTDEVAQAAIFLARAAFITGQSLIVDGGLSLVEQATVYEASHLEGSTT